MANEYESVEQVPAKARGATVVPEKSEKSDSEILGVLGIGATKKSAMPTFPDFGNDLAAKRQYFKEHMAAAFRYLGGEGYGKEGVAGHISVRDPIMPDHFWLNPLAKHFSLMRVSDLVLVNGEGNPVEGQGGNIAPINAAAFAIHHAIHEARPDVIAACHAHSIHGKAFSTLGIELDITTQDSCIFYKDHCVYDDFGGVVFESEEGRRIAQAIGNKKAIILQNHGLLTTGKTVDEAVFLFGAMDRLCQAQLLADAAAAGRGIKPIKVRDEEAEYTWKSIGKSATSWFQFQPEYERIMVTTNGDFLK